MWEKLKEITRRAAEIEELLQVPEIYGDAAKLRSLTREQKELAPVAEAYEAYQRAEQTILDATELLSDPELKEMAQEELREAKAERERLYDALRILLLPRDPNDGKNVIVRRTSTVCTSSTPKNMAIGWNCSTTMTQNLGA